jgi:hypothetical protein
MLSDLQLVQLLQDQYSGNGAFDYQGTVSGVTFAIKILADEVITCFEGSHDMPDWEHDFEAELIYPKELHGLGVHKGFYTGLVQVLEVSKPYLQNDLPKRLIGHSLGGGRCNPYAALLLQNGYTNIDRCKFGCPNSNDKACQEYIDKNSTNRSYLNYGDPFHHDPVGDVPYYIPILFPYYTKETRHLVMAKPELGDLWGSVMGWHHIQNYIKGMQNGQTANS